MAKLLIDESPLTVLPSLVKLVGLEKALVLQQVHYACQQPRSGKMLSDGKKYVWNTYEGWQTEYFPFWSTKNIQKHFLKLEADGYLISCQPRLKYGDATKYYRVDEDFLADQTHSLPEWMPSSTPVDDGIYQSRPSLKGNKDFNKDTLSSAGATPQENESDNHTQTIPYPPLQSEKKSPPPRRPMTPDEAAAYLDTAPAPAPPDPEFQTPAMVAYFDHFPTALPNGEFVRLINAHCVNLEAWKKTLTIAIAAKWRNIYNVQAFTETYDREVKKLAPKQIGIYEHPKVNKPKFLH